MEGFPWVRAEKGVHYSLLIDRNHVVVVLSKRQNRGYLRPVTARNRGLKRELKEAADGLTVAATRLLEVRGEGMKLISQLADDLIE